MFVIGWLISLSLLFAYMFTHDDTILIASGIFGMAGSLMYIAHAIRNQGKDKELD